MPTPRVTGTQSDSVLLVDDHTSFRSTLRKSLAACGFNVDEARSGEEAVEAAQSNTFDLVLLDVNMPGMGGVEACCSIRDLIPRAGIVMISVRDNEDDKIRALEAGADDYITKPVPLRELIARLQAVLRRTRGQNIQELAVLEAGQLALDLRRRILWRFGTRVHLSPKEFELLAFMMRKPDAPLPHVALLRAVWGPEYGNELEYLRFYVRTLRKKIEDDPANPRYIITEPWIGYRFRSPSASV